MRCICPFCNSTNCVEEKKIPRSCEENIRKDDMVQLMTDKFLYEIKCQDCNMTFAVDKDLYRNREK